MLPTPAGAALPVAGYAFSTLVVKPNVPLWLILPAQEALFTGTEQLAERHLLFFRVNPKSPNAVERDPSCAPGTSALLYSNIALLYGISPSIGDYLIARVVASDCKGGSLLTTESSRRIAAANVDATLVQAVVSEAFRKMDDRVSNDPAAARALGWSQTAK